MDEYNADEIDFQMINIDKNSSIADGASMYNPYQMLIIMRSLVENNFLNDPPELSGQIEMIPISTDNRNQQGFNNCRGGEAGNFRRGAHIPSRRGGAMMSGMPRGSCQNTKAPQMYDQVEPMRMNLSKMPASRMINSRGSMYPGPPQPVSDSHSRFEVDDDVINAFGSMNLNKKNPMRKSDAFSMQNPMEDNSFSFANIKSKQTTTNTVESSTLNNFGAPINQFQKSIEHVENSSTEIKFNTDVGVPTFHQSPKVNDDGLHRMAKNKPVVNPSIIDTTDAFRDPRKKLPLGKKKPITNNKPAIVEPVMSEEEKMLNKIDPKFHQLFHLFVGHEIILDQSELETVSKSDIRQIADFLVNDKSCSKNNAKKIAGEIMNYISLPAA